MTKMALRDILGPLRRGGSSAHLSFPRAVSRSPGPLFDYKKGPGGDRNHAPERRVSRMTRKHVFRPGEKSPRSGQYEIIGRQGGLTGEERTVVKKEPFPPTPKKGQGYKLVDPTKH